MLLGCCAKRVGNFEDVFSRTEPSSGTIERFPGRPDGSGISIEFTHPKCMDGWRFEDDAFPKKGNLLPVEGLNNVLSFFFKQGVWVYTKGLVFTQFFQKNGEHVLLSDKADIYHSDRTILDDDGKSNGRLGRMCKLVCHFDQTLRIHVWYIIYNIYMYIYIRICIWATFTTRIFTIHVGFHTPAPYMDPTWQKVQKKVAQFP